MNEPKIDLAQLQKMAQVNRKVLNRMKERVAILETSLDLVCDDPDMRWLYRNRSERMDPSVAMFPKLRAEFHLGRYEFAAERVSGLTVADIACGTGYGCQRLLQGGVASVTGVDICEEAIAYANRRHASGNASFVCADGSQTVLPDASFDCVVSFETIEHVPNDAKLLTEFARILKPGGLLICSTPNGWPLEIAPHHVRVYDRQSFIDTLSRQFQVDQVDSLFNQNSGSDFQYNHGQAAGIVPTTDANFETAECYLAVAVKKPEV